jgi:hypothetical protein
MKIILEVMWMVITQHHSHHHRIYWYLPFQTLDRSAFAQAKIQLSTRVVCIQKEKQTQFSSVLTATTAGWRPIVASATVILVADAG